MVEVKMTDHKFAKWLKDKGWNGRIEKIITGDTGLSEFVKDDGTLLAKVIYNNKESTHRIFIF